MLDAHKQVGPFDSCLWGTALTSTGVLDVHTMHLHQQSPEMMVAFEAVKHLDSAGCSAFGHRRIALKFHSEAQFADAQLRDIREFTRVWGHRNFFIAAETREQSDFVHWISLYRSDNDALCTEDELGLVAQLAPHLKQALAYNRVAHLDRLSQGDNALSPFGKAVASMRGVIHHANAQFRSLMAVEWNDDDAVALQPPLLAHLVSGNTRYIGRAIVVKLQIEHDLLFLTARPRCRADGLSLRESEIARHLADGMAQKAIAQVLGTSPATVNNQVQAIYAKLAVNNVAGIVSELRLRQF